MAKYTPLGAALGPDSNVLACLVDGSRPGLGGVRKSMSLRELALAAGVGEAKVAIAMKYAVKEGYAEKSGPRSLQQTWVATPKGDAWFAQTQGAVATEQPPPFMEPKGFG